LVGYLDVVFGDEPGSVRQDFVHFVEILQFGGDVVEAQQPAFVAVRLHELVHLLLDQIRTPVTTCSHNGDEMAVVEGQGSIAAHYERLRLLENLQVLRMIRHDLTESIGPTGSDAILDVNCRRKSPRLNLMDSHGIWWSMERSRYGRQ